MFQDTKRDKIFSWVNTFLLVAITIAIAYPVYFVVIASISNPTLVNSGQVWLLPRDLTLDSYEYVWDYEKIWNGYGITIMLTLVGTCINLVLTLTSAYALSKSHLPLIRGIMFLFTFTMFFGGGLIPTYLLVSKYLQLRNTIWAMILPSAVSAYNMILVRTFYMQSIPGELMDASKIDGCNDMKAFTRIVLPLSLPIIATMALFYAVGHWNQYFDALIYISDPAKAPLQLVLREILIINEQLMSAEMGSTVDPELLAIRIQLAETMKYAVIVVATIPLLIVYPFVQKWFIKGMLVGSLKG